ncbi:rna-directed dna polymerase from mobile element jockey-like [Limosa lapponica baueri]|uniref:Rna-directed dna polymerase from mobile element jockey-like n=1 Tax=Limosa lapponica baueri TaxID=1758121 RepID=A0A2I0T4U0_LIMLA|nr:rna-directed dna polymerase from mobile element jockey-like [Limosa lapponica baueri]
MSLTSELRKVMEQIILSATTRHVQDNQAIGPSQHGLMKGRPCFSNLIFYYDKEQRKALHSVCLKREGRCH